MSLTLAISKERVRSIDILRGLVMVIMALDHVREFFHSQAILQNPLDPQTATPAIYFTRWITHLCAPIFVLLSGTSIYLVGLRKTKAELSAFLLKRGLWLIFVEIVIMNFAFSFDPGYPFVFLQVIWAIGISMVILAVLIWLPFPVLFALGLVIFFGHNLLDYLEAERNGRVGTLWSLLHRQNFTNLGDNRMLGILYPFLPWTGIMLLGYSLGKWYEPTVDATVRRKRLITLGLGLLAMFFILRSINEYGDPTPRDPNLTGIQAFFSYMNVQKYPPSLMFSSVVYGIGMLLLVLFERVRNKFTDVLNIYGRVPFFYYVLHFYLIHLLTVVGFFAAGYGVADIRTPGVPFNFRPPAFGYPLWAVYLIWIGVVAVLYPLCKWYNNYKSRHNHWWLSYV
jgi:uncharacterized membrane protein